MIRKSQIQIILGTLFIIIVFSYFVINEKKVNNVSKDLEFRGIIKEIHYSEKGFLNVVINNQTYYIPTSNLQNQFRIGDSLAKAKNTIETHQYREGHLIRIYTDNITN